MCFSSFWARPVLRTSRLRCPNHFNLLESITTQPIHVVEVITEGSYFSKTRSLSFNSFLSHPSIMAGWPPSHPSVPGYGYLDIWILVKTICCRIPTLRFCVVQPSQP